MGIFSGMFGGGGSTQFADAVIRVGADTSKAVTNLSNFKKHWGAVFTAAGAGLALKYAAGLAEIGAKAQSVTRSFQPFAVAAGKTVNQMIADIKRATLGTVSSLEAQQYAMRALISGVKYDDLIVAMEYVTKYSAATGTGIAENMQKVMTGLARKSAMFMDDVGIQVMGSKDVVKDTIDQMKLKMKEFTITENDAGIAAQQMRASLEDIKATVGEDLIPTFVFATKAISGLMNVIYKPIQFIQIGFLGIMQGLYKTLELLNRIDVKFAKGDRKKELQWQLEDTRRHIKAIDDEITKISADIAGIDPIEVKVKKKSKTDQKKLTEEELKKLKDLADKYNKEQSDDLWRELNKRAKMVDGWYANLKSMAEKDKQDRSRLEEEYFKSTLTAEQLWIYEQANKYAEYYDAGIITYAEYLEKIEELGEQHKKKMDEKDAERIQKSLDTTNAMINNAATVTDAFSALSDAQTQRELRNLDKKKMSQRQYEKEQERIQRQGEERARRFARMQQIIIAGRAAMDVASAIVGAMRDTTGGAFTRIAGGVATGLAAAAQIATIQAQHFEMGKDSEQHRYRSRDSQLAWIDPAEAITPAPQAAMHADTLEAIRNNTANTASGLSRIRGGAVVNNFYGVSTEQILSVQKETERRRRTGKLL